MIYNCKITAIQSELSENPHFDMSFVDSVSKQYSQYGTISARQEKALDNIMANWLPDTKLEEPRRILLAKLDGFEL